MKDFLKNILEALDVLLPYFVSVVAAGSSVLWYFVNQKSTNEKIKVLREQLDQARSKETYIKCPKCGERLPLSSVNFYLPGDRVDNDLNGKPDDEEVVQDFLFK